jgi:hypothetical protein
MRYGSLLLASVLLACGCSNSQSGFAVRTYRMGDRVEVGSLIYNVFDVKWMPQLGDGPSARIPKDRFFLVRLSVVNSGGRPTTVPIFQVVDSNGNTHDEISAGQDVPQWIGFLRELQPADSLQGNALFDVTPAHYKLRVTDESEERVALVDIPLQFQMENPGLPEPAAPAPSPEQLRTPSNPR